MEESKDNITDDVNKIGFFNKDKLTKLILKSHFANILDDICKYLNLDEATSVNIKNELNISSGDILK